MRFKRRGFRAIRIPEALESRAMLAGNGIVPFAHLAHQFEARGATQPPATQLVSTAVAGHAASHGGRFASLGSLAAHRQTSFTATLTDSAGSATGTATYKTQYVDGAIETTFSASISGATANTTFDVAIGDTVVGQITTDDSGAGELLLSSNPTGTELALPDNFPTNIGADTAITIGTLTDMLTADANSNPESGGSCHGHAAHQTTLGATLSDADNSAATGTATYALDSENGVTTFSVSVTGAAAESTLDVSIDDTVVGQLATDSSGAGSLVLSSNSTGTQQPLALDFPTNISEGSTVTVGTLTGTLATSSSSDSAASGALYFRDFNFLRRR